MSEVTKKVTPPQARCGSSGGHLIYVKKGGLVGAFIQEKALMGAFSMIVKTDCETDGSFHCTTEEAEGGSSLGPGTVTYQHPLQQLHSLYWQPWVT